MNFIHTEVEHRYLKRWLGSLLYILPLLIAVPAIGQVNYNESTDGDLGSGPSPCTPFTVGAGVNTWTGTIESTANGAGRQDDCWDVVVPDGYQMTQVTWSGPADDDGASYVGFFEFKANPTVSTRNATFTKNFDPPKLAGTYNARIIADLSAGRAWTVTVTAEEIIIPLITSQPSSQQACPGETVSFSAEATANPAPTVQWQVSTNDGATFNDIPGETSTTYSFTTKLVDEGNQYRAVFTNTNGSTETNAATLFFKTPDVELSLSPALILTHSGALQNITAEVSVEGGCSPTVTLQSITSSDGDEVNDVQNADYGTADYSFDLRGEIAPSNDYRIYTVTYRVTDGNYSEDFSGLIVVPAGAGLVSPGGTNTCGAELGPIPEMTGSTVGIPYTVDVTAPVRITIFNAKGKIVYGLVNSPSVNPDGYLAFWDGTNNHGLYPGTQQPNGIYLVLMEACDDYRTVGILQMNRTRD